MILNNLTPMSVNKREMSPNDFHDVKKRRTISSETTQKEDEELDKVVEEKTNQRIIEDDTEKEMSEDVSSNSMSNKKDVGMLNTKTSEVRNSPDDADLTDAMVFLNRIKEDYAGQVHIYDQFLETMRDFKFGKIDSNDVCTRIRVLFKGNPHLIKSFEDYLPNNLKVGGNMRQQTMPHPVPTHGSQPIMQQHGNFRTMPYAPAQPTPLQPYMVAERYGRPQYPHPMNYQGMGMRPMQRMVPMQGYGNMNEVSQMRQHPGIPQATGQMMSDKMTKKDNQREFIEKLKKRYSPNSIVYINIIDAITTQHINGDELVKCVKTYLKNDPDLFEEFKACCDPEHRSLEKLPKATREKISLEKIRASMDERGLLGSFTMVLNYYNQNFVNGDQLFYFLNQMVENKEYLQELKSCLKYREKPPRAVIFDKEHVMGSYVKRQIPLESNDNNMFNLLLNHKYMCYNTHASEDDVYIFREKNTSEEYLIKLGDDRSEFDVQIQRLKCFLCKLIKLNSLLGDSSSDLDSTNLSMADLDMAPGIVKDILRTIYGDDSDIILEKILSSADVAIPKVIKRCQVVYKEFFAKQRENRLNWRAVAEMHYFKSYDIKGLEFKANERALLNMKAIKESSKEGYNVIVSDKNTMNFIHELIKLYIQNNISQSKKVSSEMRNTFYDNVFNNISSGQFEYSVSLEFYGLYYFILKLYSRFKELKDEKMEVEEPSKVALRMGLVTENEYKDVYQAILEYSRQCMKKEIDAEYFEEQIRVYTKTKGYKLYNLRRIIVKLDKLSTAILEKNIDKNEEGNDLYHIQKNNSMISLRRTEGVSVSEEVGEPIDEIV